MDAAAPWETLCELLKVRWKGCQRQKSDSPSAEISQCAKFILSLHPRCIKRLISPGLPPLLMQRSIRNVCAVITDCEVLSGVRSPGMKELIFGGRLKGSHQCGRSNESPPCTKHVEQHCVQIPKQRKPEGQTEHVNGVKNQYANIHLPLIMQQFSSIKCLGNFVLTLSISLPPHTKGKIFSTQFPVHVPGRSSPKTEKVRQQWLYIWTSVIHDVYILYIRLYIYIYTSPFYCTAVTCSCVQTTQCPCTLPSANSQCLNKSRVHLQLHFQMGPLCLT